MSTSIELHIEVKINGNWHHYNQPFLPDNYLMFGKMAGVGDDTIEPISAPKGLPGDPTFLTEFCYEKMKDQAVSASWLSSAEVTELSRWIKDDPRMDYSEDEFFGYLFTNRFRYFLEFRNDYPAGLEDFRFVFWFDS